MGVGDWFMLSLSTSFLSSSYFVSEHILSILHTSKIQRVKNVRSSSSNSNSNSIVVWSGRGQIVPNLQKSSKQTLMFKKYIQSNIQTNDYSID